MYRTLLRDKRNGAGIMNIARSLRIANVDKCLKYAKEMKKNFRSRPHSEEGLGLQDRRDVLLQAAALSEPKELHLAEFDGRIRLLYKNTSD